MKKAIIYLSFVLSVVSCDLVKSVVEPLTADSSAYVEPTQYKVVENVKPGVSACYLNNSDAFFLAEGPSLSEMQIDLCGLNEYDFALNEEYSKVLVYAKMTYDVTFDSDMVFTYFDNQDRVAFIVMCSYYNYYNSRCVIYGNYTDGKCDMAVFDDYLVNSMLINLPEVAVDTISGGEKAFIAALSKVDAMASSLSRSMPDYEIAAEFAKRVKSAKTLLSSSGSDTRLDERYMSFFENAINRLYNRNNFRELALYYSPLNHFPHETFHSYFSQKYGKVEIEGNDAIQLSANTYELSYKVKNYNSGLKLKRSVVWADKEELSEAGEIPFTDYVENKAYKHIVTVPSTSAVEFFHILLYPEDYYFPFAFTELVNVSSK